MSRRNDGYWGLLNPAFAWLSFLPPFLAFATGFRLAPMWGVVAVVIAVYLLFKQPDRPFRIGFYLPPLFSLFLAYVLAPQYALMLLLAADIWMNSAVFFSRGSGYARIYESIFASKLLGVLLMVYIFVLVAFDLKWYGSALYLGWIPSALLLTVYAAQTLRYYFVPAQREVKMLLPVVRIAVVRGEKLLVREGGDGRLDLPFTFPVNPGEAPYEVAETKIRQLTEREPKFLLKYRQETGEGERVVYLFVLNLRHGDPFEIPGREYEKCRFIPRDESGETAFTAELKEEYAYLSSTIFLTNSMLSRI